VKVATPPPPAVAIYFHFFTRIGLSVKGFSLVTTEHRSINFLKAKVWTWTSACVTHSERK